jgi:hypothetical protein
LTLSFFLSFSERLAGAASTVLGGSRRRAAWAILPALFVLLAGASHAAAIVVPTGLNPGATYRIIFVTSTMRDGTSANIADYNSFVTDAANLDAGLAGLGTTWKALASTPTVNVLVNAGLSAGDSTTPFYNTVGNLIAIGVTVPITGLYGGFSTAHTSPIFSETGEVPPGSSFVWTGTRFNTSVGSPLGGAGAHMGRYTSTSRGWTQEFSENPAALHHLYGISGVLTVPAASEVPEPSALALVGSALLALGIARRRGVRR